MTISHRMAQALIDIHNTLPDGLDDLIQAHQNDDLDLDLCDYLELQFSNLLVDLWKIQYRFKPLVLEKVVKEGVEEVVINSTIPIEEEKKHP